MVQLHRLTIGEACARVCHGLILRNGCVCRLLGIGRQLREHNINLSAATADPAYHHHVLGRVHVLPRTLRDSAAHTHLFVLTEVRYF